MLFKKERVETTVSKESVMDALRQIIDPDLHRDIRVALRQRERL